VPQRAQEVNRALAKYVDVMLRNEEDLPRRSGSKVANVGESFDNLQVDSFSGDDRASHRDVPTSRSWRPRCANAKTASINDWGALCYADGKALHARTREDLAIYDASGRRLVRVGAEFYGLLSGKDPQCPIECGAAHGGGDETG